MISSGQEEPVDRAPPRLPEPEALHRRDPPSARRVPRREERQGKHADGRGIQQEEEEGLGDAAGGE